MRKVLTFLGIALVLMVSIFLFAQRNKANDLRIELPEELGGIHFNGGASSMDTDFGLSVETEPTVMMLGINEEPANREAWRDFRVFIGIMEDADSQVQQLYNQLINIESEKAEIIDDAERLAELKKIIDIHPDYTVVDIAAKLNKFKALRRHLENNGYIE